MIPIRAIRWLAQPGQEKMNIKRNRIIEQGKDGGRSSFPSVAAVSLLVSVDGSEVALTPVGGGVGVHPVSVAEVDVPGRRHREDFGCRRPRLRIGSEM